MRRANGDWFAVADEGSLRVPIFYTASDAMLARSRDSGLECFRPVVLDEAAFKNLTTADEGGSYWLVADPLRKLKLAPRLNLQELVAFVNQPEPLARGEEGRK
jgi:hypothetical protein